MSILTNTKYKFKLSCLNIAYFETLQDPFGFSICRHAICLFFNQFM